MDVDLMNEYYLSRDKIITKTDEWMKSYNIPKYRMRNITFNHNNSALIVIDMQEYFINKSSHAFIPSAQFIVPNINSLIERYKKLNLPIIFTMHAYKNNEDPGIMGRWWRDVLRVNNPMSKIHSKINWNKNDITLRKNRYSAFIGTNLDEMLTGMNINTLIISGVMTHLCCESTARDAFMKDYETYFVIDATAATSEVLHVSSLRTLVDGFVIPVRTSDIIKETDNYA
ncbi:MAG: cysteine hydrolase [Thermoplasmatales archaeon]|nr:cysteine hydrolase [Thermoplasmatales archaeon]